MTAYSFTPAAYESPNAGDLGPAMKQLNPRQRAVVYWLLDNGRGSDKGDWLDAMRAAGYTDNDNGALRVSAFHLKRNPKMAAALVEEGARRPNFDLPMALMTIRTIAADPSHRDALKAATTLAAMSGVSAVTKTSSEHTERRVMEIDTASIEARLALLPPDIAENLRMAILPAPQKMIDITPSVEPSPSMTEEEALAELKDFL